MQRAVADRLTLSDAIEAAGRIVGCYPNGGQGAGKSYIGALAATLCSYPKSVSLRCADPLKGVVIECKFLPTVADIVAFCERAGEPLYREAEREYRLKEQFQLREQAAPSAESKARVEAMRLEVHRELDGSAELSLRAAENEERAAEARDRRLHEVKTEWGDKDAPTLAGIPVSHELIDSMERRDE